MGVKRGIEATGPLPEPEKTQKELAEEGQLKWNYGLEIYYRNRKHLNKRELFVLYYNTESERKLWMDRFDLII